MRADGSNQTRITHSPGWDFAFSWSRRGGIAFNSDTTGTFDIYATDLAGSRLKRITSDEAYDFYARPRPRRSRSTR